MWATVRNAFTAATGGLNLRLMAFAVGGIALIAAAFFAYSHIAKTYKDADKRGYDRGRAEMLSRWNAAQAVVLAKNAELLARYQRAGTDAVAAYKADAANRAPAVAAVTKDRIVYVEAKANAVPCVDRAGVDILRRNRSANGISAGPAAAPAAR